MRPTIRDVARRAGVSIATVSRVVRDHDSVTPATRDRVTSAIEELKYTPSQLGRQLAERRHAANGIVFPDLSGPYYAEVVLGYEAVAAELGRSVLILSTSGRAAAESMVTDMAGRCDGLVILGRTVPDSVVERLASQGAPLVLLARPPLAGLDSVNAENSDSARRLAEHVISTGARRLVFVGDPEGSPDVAERWRGIEEAAARHPEVTLVLHRSSEYGEEAGGAIARALLAASTPRRGPGSDAGDNPAAKLPDAFLCANDELALGLMSQLKAAGIDVPGRVRVTGWDDVMAARYAGLTTVRQPMRQLGATAARLLDELINGLRTEPRHELLPTELVVRTSTANL